MFNNLIRLDDFRRVVEKLRQGHGRRLLQLLRPSSADRRVREAWQHVDSPARSLADIPAVQRMWSERITGDPDQAFRPFIADRFLSESNDVKAISLGCGSGANEVRWMKTGRFASITGYDISDDRIEAAQTRAEKEGLTRHLTFLKGDARRLDVPSGSVDVVIAEASLHHMSPLEPTISEIQRVLKPEGLIFLRDFVGPSSFQWTERQLELTQALLQIIPSHLRVRARSGTIKSRFLAPGRLAMLLSDPSEAAESSRIRPLMEAHFETIFLRPLGGTILQLLFDEIALNFLAETEEVRFWTRVAIELEAHLVSQKVLDSDFIFAVYRKRTI